MCVLEQRWSSTVHIPTSTGLEHLDTDCIQNWLGLDFLSTWTPNCIPKRMGLEHLSADCTPNCTHGFRAYGQ